jgi:hypothetical protein
MNAKEALAMLAEFRARNARMVLDAPEQFKICEGCFSCCIGAARYVRSAMPIGSMRPEGT